jgi:hypothetical protein
MFYFDKRENTNCTLHDTSDNYLNKKTFYLLQVQIIASTVINLSVLGIKAEANAKKKNISQRLKDFTKI